jgi:hypothetical protein
MNPLNIFKRKHNAFRRWTDLHASASPTVAATLPPRSGYRREPTGWAGGRFEWMFLPLWSVKTEYLFLGINDNVQTCVPIPQGSPLFQSKIRGRTHRQLGLNYHHALSMRDRSQAPEVLISGLFACSRPSRIDRTAKQPTS